MSMQETSEENSSPKVLSRAQRMPVISMLFRRLNARQREIVSLLRRTTIFSELTESELVELLHLLHERTFVQGEVIFSEGEPGLGLYVIFTGEVQIGTTNGEGQGRFGKLGPGDVFGEVSFLDGSGRSATTTASVRSELIGFYRTELMDLIERRPALASKILLAMARQMSLRMRAMLQMIPPTA